ncbi:MAG: aspartate--tRNA ligase [Candidatus Kerfeldbacteria bacterium]|nr:aspartate--tRNA ligase [Candidatus Kerfeldbacteria bacterium]
MNPRILAAETPAHLDQTVTLKGWVHVRRDMGKIIFIHLRDRSGQVQVVFVPGECPDYELAKTLRDEFVVAITGQVAKRGPKNVNANMLTGTVEIQARALEVLSAAQTPPFPLADTQPVSEDARLTYRYLDLRSPRMNENIRFRSRVNMFLRNYLVTEGFTEIETPYITKGTPEGAREFIIPSRQHAGQFYVLPQSPQQFKQLLMVGGLERYFQIVRCFRDEDQRGDRQPEFTQLDLEMSFVEQADVLELVERMFTALVTELCPEKTFTATPFPRITYAEAMAKWGNDKPDIRKNPSDPNELGFCFIVDFPLFEYSDAEKKLVSTHHLFTSPQAADLPLLDTDPSKVKGQQYDFVLNGFEIAGGSIRIHDQELQRKIFKILKLSDEEIETKFGHMLRAFSYGVPPHGGIAPGLDRIVMLLRNEPNIREVIAFPKTGDARDLMMGAPSELPPTALREAHIQLRSKKE